VGFPRYDESPLPEAPDRCNEACQKAVDTGDARLRELAALLPGPRATQPGATVLCALARWEESLRRLDVEGRRVEPHVLADLCTHHAALWQLLEQWLQAQSGDADAFRTHAARAPHPV